MVLAATGASAIDTTERERADETSMEGGVGAVNGDNGTKIADPTTTHNDEIGVEEDVDSLTGSKSDRSDDYNEEQETNMYVGVRDLNDYGNESQEVNVMEQKDESGNRFIIAEDLRKLLITMGDKLTDEEADQLINECKPIEARHPSDHGRRVNMILATNFMDMLLPGSS